MSKSTGFTLSSVSGEKSSLLTVLSISAKFTSVSTFAASRVALASAKPTVTMRSQPSATRLSMLPAYWSSDADSAAFVSTPSRSAAATTPL